MKFEEINVNEIDKNVFDMIGKQWMLVTAAKSEDEVNTMTASWGGLGIMWGKPVAYVFIRPQRYTKEFIDASEKMSLSFFTEDYRKMLSYMGTTSGRDEDKIKKSELNISFENEAPYFNEAEVVLITKKLYAQNMGEEFLLDKEIAGKWYPANDWHTMYVCEIEKVLINKEK